MRDLFIIFVFLAFGGYAAELAAPPCNCAWEEDFQQFKEQTVNFDSHSASLSDEARQKISEVAAYLKANPQSAVRIDGHCDYRGTKEHNRRLGDRRARAALEELIRKGVDPERIDWLSYGEDRPVDPGHNSVARQKNRRVVFVLLRPPDCG